MAILKHALDVAQQYENAYTKGLALRKIADALVEAGDKEQALAILEQAFQGAQKIEDANFCRPLAVQISSSMGLWQ